MDTSPRKISRWLPVVPCGLGTGHVESLTSYLVRSASIHGVTPWGLIVRELAPRFPRKIVVDKRGHSDFFGHVGASLNGVSATANGTVAILTDLTGRNDLASLTLLPLSEIVSPRDSVQQHARWCPECFSTWAQERKDIYEPLLWHLKSVGVCLKHSAKLVSHCPHCERLHYPLERRSLPGICPRCGGWLGVCGPRREVATDADVRIARQCEDLISRASLGTCKPSSQILATNLMRIRKSVFHGSTSAFAKAARMHHSSLGDLLAGGTRLGLDSLVGLSMASGSWASALVGERISPESLAPPAWAPIPSRRCRKYDWKEVERMLNGSRQSVQSSVSLTALCRQRGLDSGYVAANLTDDACRLVRRFRGAASHRKARREAAEAKDLTSQIRACFRRLVWPSYRRLRRMLKNPGSLRDPKLERLRFEVISAEMRRLGIKKWREFAGVGIDLTCGFSE